MAPKPKTDDEIIERLRKKYSRAIFYDIEVTNFVEEAITLAKEAGRLELIEDLKAMDKRLKQKHTKDNNYTHLDGGKLTK